VLKNKIKIIAGISLASLTLTGCLAGNEENSAFGFNFSNPFANNAVNVADETAEPDLATTTHNRDDELFNIARNIGRPNWPSPIEFNENEIYGMNQHIQIDDTIARLFTNSASYIAVRDETRVTASFRFFTTEALEAGIANAESDGGMGFLLPYSMLVESSSADVEMQLILPSGEIVEQSANTARGGWFLIPGDVRDAIPNAQLRAIINGTSVMFSLEDVSIW